MKKRCLGLSMALALMGSVSGLCPVPAVAEPSTQSAQQLHTPEESLNQVEAIAEAFVEALVNEDYAQATVNFESSIRRAWTPAEIEAQWQNVVTANGNFRTFVDTRSLQFITSSDYLVSIRVGFENRADDILVILDSEQKIIGVDFPRYRQDIRVLAEEWVDALANDDFALARLNLHPDLKREWSIEDIERRWEAVQRSTGRLERRFAAEVRQGGIYDIVIVPVEFENVTDDLLITFDVQRRIIGIDFPLELEDE